MGARHMAGTPWHLELTPRKKDDDPRRNKTRCKYYSGNRDKYCAYCFSICQGSAHCPVYKEKTRKGLASGQDINKRLNRKRDEGNIVKPDFSAKHFFPIGSKIIHNKYGSGTVAKISKGRISIIFDEHGEKRFSADYCISKSLIRTAGEVLLSD